MTPHWIILPTPLMAIRFEPKEYALDFGVFNACQLHDGTWELLTESGGPVPFSKWALAWPEISGHLKWDGCINWHTNEDCMAHACGPEMIAELAAVFTAVYATGARQFTEFRERAPAMPIDAIQIAEEALS